MRLTIFTFMLTSCGGSGDPQDTLHDVVPCTAGVWVSAGQTDCEQACADSPRGQGAGPGVCYFDAPADERNQLFDDGRSAGELKCSGTLRTYYDADGMTYFGCCDPQGAAGDLSPTVTFHECKP